MGCAGATYSAAEAMVPLMTETRLTLQATELNGSIVKRLPSMTNVG